MISVIVPAFDAAPFIAAALESILDQTLPPGEIIVADDGSSDATARIAEEFGKPVRVLRLSHGGPSAASNAGVAAAAGELLAFLDADDLWATDKLAAQLAVLEADKTLDAVFGQVVQFADYERVIRSPQEIRNGEAPVDGISKNSMLIRRAAFDRVGPFDETLEIAEFSDWYPRALAAELRSTTLPQVVAYRRVHDSNTTRTNRAALHRDYLRIAREAIARRQPADGQR